MNLLSKTWPYPNHQLLIHLEAGIDRIEIATDKWTWGRKSDRNGDAFQDHVSIKGAKAMDHQHEFPQLTTVEGDKMTVANLGAQHPSTTCGFQRNCYTNGGGAKSNAHKEKSPPQARNPKQNNKEREKQKVKVGKQMNVERTRTADEKRNTDEQRRMTRPKRVNPAYTRL
jgi:hypothetical protein